jgi:rod shape-determining protein MreC
MESLLHRYRHITVLFVAIIAQIAAVAYQVRRDNDVPLLRVWAVSAVTPVASAIENLRSGAFGVFTDYFNFRGTRDQGRALRSERDRLRLENQLLKNELAVAQRAGSLAGFQAHTPSHMIGARVIGATTGMGTRSVLIDQGKFAGVQKGMAVVTPEGIVGKVLAVYPWASQVLSVTDAGFAAAVETQKNHTRGVMKGMGSSTAKIDYVPSGQKVEKGEAFFTSGDDRVFPRGMPAGRVISVEDGATFQDIYVEPYGAEAAPEEVFVIVDPVHQEIPDAPPPDAPVFLGPDTNAAASGAVQSQATGTQADQLVEQYRKIGAAQGHTIGEAGPGALPPNFNLKVPGVNAPAAAAGASGGVVPVSATGSTARTAGASGVVRPIARPPGASGLSGTQPRAASGGAGRTGFVRTAGGASGVVRPIARPAGASGLSGTQLRTTAGASGLMRRAGAAGASGVRASGVTTAARPPVAGATQP